MNNKCDKGTQNSKSKRTGLRQFSLYPILDPILSYLVGNSRNYSKKIIVIWQLYSDAHDSPEPRSSAYRVQDSFRNLNHFKDRLKGPSS